MSYRELTDLQLANVLRNHHVPTVVREAALDRILTLALRVAELERLLHADSPPPSLPTDQLLSARRWDALMSSARMLMKDSTGFAPHNGTYKQLNIVFHSYLACWRPNTEHDTQQLLTSFADHIIHQESHPLD